MRAGLVIAMMGVASVAHARSVTIDPVGLGTPMVSPPVDVVLDGRPEAFGLTCDGISSASNTREPVLEWKLTAEAPNLRVSVTGARGVILDPDQTWRCDDGQGEILLAGAQAGDYKLYVFAPAAKATVTIRIESPPRIREVVERARDRAPAITIGAASRPNPQIRTLPRNVAGQARDLHFCRGDREAFMPIARVIVTDDLAKLRVAEPRARRIGKRAAALQLVDGGGRCVAAGAVGAGAYSLWAEIERDHPPAEVTVELDDTARPIDWADAPEVKLSELAEPLVVDGKIAKPAPRPARATTRCKPVAGLPSFYLVASAPQPVDLRLVWTRRPQWFLIEGPGVSRCIGDGAPTAIDVAAGRTAVWAGGDVGTGYMFLVHRTGAAINPYASYAHPLAGMTLAERVLPHFYPFFAAGGDEAVAMASAETLFTSAPEPIFVYARGEPLILLALEGADADVLAYDGTTRRVGASELATARPATIALPAAPPADADPDLDAAIPHAAPEDAAAIASFQAVRDAFAACAEAQRAQGAAEAAVRKACKGAGVDQGAAALLRGLVASRAARRVEVLAAIRKRWLPAAK